MPRLVQRKVYPKTGKKFDIDNVLLQNKHIEKELPDVELEFESVVLHVPVWDKEFLFEHNSKGKNKFTLKEIFHFLQKDVKYAIANYVYPKAPIVNKMITKKMAASRFIDYYISQVTIMPSGHIYFVFHNRNEKGKKQ